MNYGIWNLQITNILIVGKKGNLYILQNLYLNQELLKKKKSQSTSIFIRM